MEYLMASLHGCSSLQEQKTECQIAAGDPQASPPHPAQIIVHNRLLFLGSIMIQLPWTEVCNEPLC